jgi:putative transposase
VKYAWIKENRHTYPITLMCGTLNVSHSSYYDWLKKVPSALMLDDQRLSRKIKKLFIETKCIYGSRRLRKGLLAQGERISRRRTRKLMKANNLYCKTKRKFRITTDSNHSLPIAPNLLERNFSADMPDKKYVGDITYIPTQEGWLYLATVIDLFSRRIVGWSMAKSMEASLVNDALLMAIWSRKPKAGLIWHTDRGSQYASESHRAILQEHGISQSMSRKGNCWDNAVAESFFHTLKTELTYHHQFRTREEAKAAIFYYIEIFYNRERFHSTNNYMSPADYEDRLVI